MPAAAFLQPLGVPRVAASRKCVCPSERKRFYLCAQPQQPESGQPQARAISELEQNTTIFETARVDADPGPSSFQDSDAVATTAQALLDDIASNPQYYLNVCGVLLGMVLSFIVLSATVVALDAMPVVPDVLRFIGLAYVFWFLGKFLFSASERRRLSREVDEFVAGVRDGEYTVVSGSTDSSPTLQDGSEKVST